MLMRCIAFLASPLASARMSTSSPDSMGSDSEADENRRSLGAPGALPFSFKVNQAYVDEVVTLDDDLICAGSTLFQEEAKLAVEPAAGAALAAVLGPLRERLQGKRIGVVVCGSNIDAAAYGAVLERGRGHVERLLGPA